MTENLIETKKIYLGFETSKLLKQVKGVIELDIIKFKKECPTFLIKTIDKIKERCPSKCKAFRGLVSFDSVILSNWSSIGENKIDVLL